MEKLYFDMTDAERTLTHLIDTVDFAGTTIAEGVVAEYKTFSTKELIDMQSKISDHLFKASHLLVELLSDIKVFEVDKQQDEDDESTISLNMKEATREEVEEIIKSEKLYLTGLVYDEEDNVIGASLTFRDNNDVEELSYFKSINFYNDGKIMVSDKY